MTILASLPNAPRQGLSRVERVARLLRAIPFAGGVGLVVLVGGSFAIPSIRQTSWYLRLAFGCFIACLLYPMAHVITIALEANAKEKA